MKRSIKGFVCLVLSLMVLSGCATYMPTGAAFTEIAIPVNATPAAKAPTKTGESKCTSVLGLVANGDASIAAACKAGGITEIHHVDWKAKNIFGVYGEFTCVVYGN